MFIAKEIHIMVPSSEPGRLKIEKTIPIKSRPTLCTYEIGDLVTDGSLRELYPTQNFYFHTADSDSMYVVRDLDRGFYDLTTALHFSLQELNGLFSVVNDQRTRMASKEEVAMWQLLLKIHQYIAGLDEADSINEFCFSRPVLSS